MKYEIIKNQLQHLGADNYLLEEERMEEFGDVVLLKNQLAFVFEIYFEKSGYCTVEDEKHSHYIEATEGNTRKNTYNDATENIKTFLYEKVHLLTNDFVFAGTAYNAYLRYIKVTVLEASGIMKKLIEGPIEEKKSLILFNAVVSDNKYIVNAELHKTT